MVGKPKILLFIDWYIPGYKAGGPIRSCANMIAALSDKYEFYVVTRDSDYTENQSYEGIVSNQWQIGRWGEQVYFFSKEQLNRKNLRQLILEHDFDIAYINGIYSYYFSILPLILCRKRRDKKIIIATRGMLASTAIEVKGSKKRLFLNLAKFAGIYRNVRFHATNVSEEKDIKNEITKSAEVLVADNFPLATQIEENRKSSKVSGELRIINLARISPEKNLLFALEVIKKITKGKIIFDIYGPIYDQNYFQTCQEVVKSMPTSIQVNFKGSVAPELVAATFKNYDLFIMPTKGENFGHSISESLANGTPVLISDKTPWTEVNNSNCGAAISLERAEEFVGFINKMIDLNQEEHQKIIAASVQFAAKKNDTTHLIEQYRLLFN